MLNLGDTIGIIALSGKCEREKVLNSKAYFESLGYKVELSKNIFDEKRYLAGTDEDKISELHKFFLNSDIKLILCARGGYGAIRLINKIDYELIKSNSKPFCGFSDVTALLLMIYKKTGMVTYHSPMACSDFGNVTIPPKRKKELFTQQNFFEAVNGNFPNFEGKKIYTNGSAKGTLWGGNLATVVSLCGQDFIPDDDFIFFAEDLNEPVYKIDRMFQQLININEFTARCKGIVLGEFLDTDEELLESYFVELSERLQIPMAGGYKITHGAEKITLPIGKSAELTGKKLIIL